MKKLSLVDDLGAEFLRIEQPGRQYQRVDSLEEAQGLRFLCPKCFAINGGRKGTHSIICWSSSRGTPDTEHPGPGRWRMDGTGLRDLTLNGEAGKSRSVLLTGGCGWHGFIDDGFAHGDIPG